MPSTHDTCWGCILIRELLTCLKITHSYMLQVYVPSGKHAIRRCRQYYSGLSSRASLFASDLGRNHNPRDDKTVCYSFSSSADDLLTVVGPTGPSNLSNMMTSAHSFLTGWNSSKMHYGNLILPLTQIVQWLSSEAEVQLFRGRAVNCQCDGHGQQQHLWRPSPCDCARVRDLIGN